MQCAADFHDPIADARFPQAARVVDNATALDAAVDVLDADATACDASIRGFLGAREGSAPRLLGGHDDLDLVERERQKAEVLEQPAAGGPGVGRGIRNPFIMGAAGVRLTQKEDREHRVDQQHVLHRVALFLTAITARLLSRILGALNTPFGAIMAKRGGTGAGTGATAGGSAGVGSPSVGTTMAAASASATPMRWANAVKDRVGASPSVCSAAGKTTKRT
jgi:hypothetical protein